MDPTSCRVHVGRVARAQRSKAEWLTDKGEVVITTRGVRDRGAAVGRDAQQGLVGDVSAVYRNRASGARFALAPLVADQSAAGVADANGIAHITATVDVTDRDDATIGRRRRHPTVARRSGIRELHVGLPFRVPTVPTPWVNSHPYPAPPARWRP